MECRKCRQTPGLAGSAITEYKCVLCGKDDIWYSTDPPKLCRECSIQAIKDKSRCHWCGSLFIKAMEEEHE